MLMLIVNSMARLTCFICDPLSKTWHIPDFMKIEIRPEIDISMFSCAAVKKMEVIGCLVPSYGGKRIADAECKFSRRTQYFYTVTVNCNVSVYYRVT